MPRFSRRALHAPALALVLAGAVAAAQEPAAVTPSLEQVVEAALARSERAKQAETRVDAADARVARARAFFFPDLTLTGQYTRRKQAVVRDVAGEEVTLQSQNALSASFSASLILFDARSLPLYRQAYAERDAAALDAADAARLIGFEAADAFFQTLGQEQVTAAAARRLAFARERLADARARAEARLASSNDVTRAELEVADAELAATTASGALADAYLRLGDLVGVTVTGPLVPPASLLRVARAPIDAGATAPLWAQAQRERPDLRAAAVRIVASREAAKVPGRGFWPTLGVTGQVRTTNESGFSGESADWFIGVTLVWELWDGGERAAETREAEANVEFAELEHADQVRAARLQLERAIVALATAQKALQQAEAQVTLAARNAEEVTILYGQGLARALEVADANQQLFDAEVALAQAGYGLAVAYLDLRLAVGLGALGEAVTW